MADNKWARIHVLGPGPRDGVVDEVLSLPDTFVPGKNIFSPEMVFVNVTNVDDVDVLWTYVDAAFSAPAIAPSIPTLIISAEKYRDQIMNAGITVTLQESGQPDLILEVDTTGDGRANILGLQKLNDFGHDILWIESTGPGTLTRPQLDVLGVQAGLYVGNCYVAWASVVAGITNGSITTDSAIINYNWPAKTMTVVI